MYEVLGRGANIAIKRFASIRNNTDVSIVAGEDEDQHQFDGSASRGR
jgi:hypothetical protein